ncbi:MAG TPA: deoxyribodipyrimidine photo-lyase [Candidatus Bathyarchaeia archaeon]|nr:deoxyribodipyrimidine photo-lyase [Candidatus Bathyarchaeia archaeon]
MTQPATVVVLFNRDLRLHDHPALAEAIRTTGAVLPLFVLDDAILASVKRAPNRVAFLLQSLADLDASLRAIGGRLVVRRGDVVAEAIQAARAARARAIFASADVSACAQRREQRLEHACTASGIQWRCFPGVAVVPPGELRPQGGDHFRVFSPYWRRWSTASLRTLVPAPRRIALPPGFGRREDPLPHLEALAEGMPSPDLPRGGEAAGRARLASWSRGRLARYAELHDAVAADGTSRLSPYLHFGCLSPLEVAQRLERHPLAEPFLRQLCWRDFFAQVIHAFPAYSQDDYRPGAHAWRDDGEALERWKEGRTGYPLVDAGMRQLRREGWMHNRARLVTASFLVKDLRVDWRLGAAHFLDWLVDGDVASNSGNWQWVAGTGNDPRPGRMFNPTRQGERFDPGGDYVRRYVPELAALAGRRVHQPWLLDRAERRRLDYPPPIVDHARAALAFHDERSRQRRSALPAAAKPVLTSASRPSRALRAQRRQGRGHPIH